MKQYNIARESVIKQAKQVNMGELYLDFQQIQPQLTLFISKTNDWIAWTPKGYYNASKNGAKYIGFHINHGAEHEAEFITLNDAKVLLYRPDIITKAWRGEDISKYDNDISVEKILKAKGK